MALDDLEHLFYLPGTRDRNVIGPIQPEAGHLLVHVVQSPYFAVDQSSRPN